MPNSDADDLLKILEAHGQQFLGNFASSAMTGKRKGKELQGEEDEATKKRKVVDEGLSGDEDDSAPEWTGFGNEDEDEDDASDPAEEDVSDDDFVFDGSSTQQTTSRQPVVVVFSEKQPNAESVKLSKVQMKAFMSSKVTKVTAEVQEQAEDGEAEDEDEELTNAQNDALLHRLVHTRLLSGSLNPELELTGAQRKKALAGRVLEAAGQTKLGKGENSVRLAERNKAAKRVREGMAAKQKERNQKELEEAKALGNYHPTLKKIYEASSQPNAHNRKRERGIKMGVGSFKGGVLKLRKEDINAIQGSSGRERGRGHPKRGGKR